MLARPARLELATSRSATWRSIQLSYGRVISLSRRRGNLANPLASAASELTRTAAEIEGARCRSASMPLAREASEARSSGESATPSEVNKEDSSTRLEARADRKTRSASARANVRSAHIGGEGGIRTLGTVSGTRDFQSRTFSRSATSPRALFIWDWTHRRRGFRRRSVWPPALASVPNRLRANRVRSKRSAQRAGVLRSKQGRLVDAPRKSRRLR